MITALRIRKFKCHDDTELALSRINVLIGPQGSGKSSVVHALRLLAESAGREGINFSAGPLKGLTFRDVVHKCNEREILRLELALRLSGAPLLLSQASEFGLTYEISFNSGGFHEQHARYDFGTRIFEFRTPYRGRPDVPPDFTIDKQRPAVRFSGSTFTCYPFRFTVEGRDYPLHKTFNDLRLALADFLKDSHFVPEERALRAASVEETAVAEGAPRTFDQLAVKLASEWDVKEEVSERLNRLVGRRMNFRVAAGGVHIEASAGAVLPATCEGAGLRCMLWPLAAVVMAPPQSLVCVEEPEIHLHPRVLADFARAMAEIAMEKGVQLLLTTHNEHLVLALLSAVAKGEIPSSEFALYAAQERDGVAAFERLHVDDRGQVEGGLRGFFEAALEELRERIEALQEDR